MRASADLQPRHGAGSRESSGTRAIQRLEPRAREFHPLTSESEGRPAGVAAATTPDGGAHGAAEEEERGGGRRTGGGVRLGELLGALCFASLVGCALVFCFYFFIFN
jgi:hypothetical protein